MSAWRKSKGRTISSDAADDAARAARAAPAARCAGTTGSRFSTCSPRCGRLAPRRKSAITISRNTSSCCEPGSAMPWSVGNQLLRRGVVEDVLGRSPIASPAAQAIAERREAGEQRGRQRGHDRRAAARCESSCVTGAASTPSAPAIDARDQRVGHREPVGGEARPASPTSSFSNAARVSSPKRVQR